MPTATSEVLCYWICFLKISHPVLPDYVRPDLIGYINVETCIMLLISPKVSDHQVAIYNYKSWELNTNVTKIIMSKNPVLWSLGEHSQPTLFQEIWLEIVSYLNPDWTWTQRGWRQRRLVIGRSCRCSPCACKGPELREDPVHGWPVGHKDNKYFFQNKSKSSIKSL